MDTCLLSFKNAFFFQENDKLLIGLCYEPEEEKLTLAINSVKIGSQSSIKICSEVGLYAKVTLFESLRVVKAKKTRPLKLIRDHGNFDETFSILFPMSYMNQVFKKFTF